MRSGEIEGNGETAEPTWAYPHQLLRQKLAKSNSEASHLRAQRPPALAYDRL